MTKPKTNDNLFRVLRGGCWVGNYPAAVRAHPGNTNTPSYRGRYVGFRTTLTGRTPR